MDRKFEHGNKILFFSKKKILFIYFYRKGKGGREGGRVKERQGESVTEMDVREKHRSSIGCLSYVP